MNNKIVTYKGQRVEIKNDTPHVPDEIIPNYLKTLKTDVDTEIKKRLDRGIKINFAAQELFLRAVFYVEKIYFCDDDIKSDGSV
ncbi:MAG: hypothetical protein C5B43_00720 [Verrucomicrobia bacterium]|nr:MAG: hypothetical protein C5B43_00720 [Verrucomicrobiota bacterium]